MMERANKRTGVVRRHLVTARGRSPRPLRCLHQYLLHDAAILSDRYVDVFIIGHDEALLRFCLVRGRG